MKKKILIVTGDNLGLSNEQIGYNDIEILKFPVIIDGEEFRENEEHTAKYLMDRFKHEKVVAKTQAITKTDLINAIEKNKSSYDVIIHLTMSHKMSSATFQIAESVKKQYEGIIPIINIDSKQVTSGVGAVLLRLIDLIEENKGVEEIENEMNLIVNNTFLFLALPDLGFLYRGGRIGKAKSLLGSIIKIIPVVGLLGNEPEPIIIP
ncbi:MAG: fatty acid-binding protein DegV, partial [Candidatus Neomarinimicrobiota bacterium]